MLHLKAKIKPLKIHLNIRLIQSKNVIFIDGPNVLHFTIQSHKIYFGV